MPEAPADGLTDLERELTCSICTDLLYQPLTLLDCLHTYCGSCLRDWFAWQASNATTPSPYTCPACRAPVRGTKPNATVTTLLDVLLKAHPGKGKDAAERAKIAQTYKLGDNVIPPVSISNGSSDSEDQQMLERARDLSLQALDAGSSRRRDGERARQASRRARDAPVSTGPSRPRRSQEQARTSRGSQPSTSQRQIEHQASLRSLLSASDLDLDSTEMEEEIMRQIVDDGLLEGVDLNSLTPAQEEEITERIARAFRSRQRTGTGTSRDTTPQTSAPRATSSNRRRAPGGRSPSSNRRSRREPPPLSNPHLLEVATDRHRRSHSRSSSQGSHQSMHSAHSTNNRDSSRGPPSGTLPAASRSTVNVALSAESEGSTLRRPRTRTLTDPDEVLAARQRATSGSTVQQQAEMTSFSYAPRADSTAARLDRRSASSGEAVIITAPPARTVRTFPSMPGPPSRIRPLIPQRSSSNFALATAAALPAEPPSPPSIKCSRCGKPEIQCDLHYKCSRCEDGAFHLCLACYRAGRGCKHWFGFGHTAQLKFDRMELAADAEPPHILSAQRFTHSSLASSDSTPASRTRGVELLEGTFCDICKCETNACYWHCDVCNDGAWGYCQRCLQQGHHCSHPLVAVALKSLVPKQDHISLTGYGDVSRPHVPLPDTVQWPLLVNDIQKPLPHIPTADDYGPLILPCECDICHRAIPTTSPRHHCYTCSSGDYDICTDCYDFLVPTSYLDPANGPQGWHRCPTGHRMVLIGFSMTETSAPFLQRYIQSDLIGGWALKDDAAPTSTSTSAAPPHDTSDRARWRWRDADGTSHTSSSPPPPPILLNAQTGTLHTTPAAAALDPPSRHGRTASASTSSRLPLPPPGGVGLRVLALWSYFPAENVQDELAFPRGAQISEAEDINGDWFWGVYAGRKGLFPGNYGRIVGRV